MWVFLYTHIWAGNLDRFQQTDEERPDRFAHLVGLPGDAFHVDAHRQIRHQFGDPAIVFGAHPLRMEQRHRMDLDEIVDASGTMGKLYKVLTPSEIKVAEFIRMGMSSKDIANTLEITQKTVENHRNNLREKLGLKNKGVNLQVFLMNVGEQDGNP